ncbi:MAG: hypothetical protein AVDCRST_MAG89-3635 [uncultured Gemmatimonadetes bacterium]|uniref:Uncharacterized protein n=1 Tax=uncultured Gemmatimonadota bacterium TaxID=203437 RepID=A0A6J4MJ69_9BACT|nr:MAG: hypothetical protein AVDCRST_MAG89-3635 [uncultured Gemmatimonadota bacterium]
MRGLRGTGDRGQGTAGNCEGRSPGSLYRIREIYGVLW